MTTLRIGDHVSFGGRTYRVRGFEPMSFETNHVEIEDLETGARRPVPLAQLEAAVGLASVEARTEPKPG